MIPFYSDYYDASETFHGFLPKIMGTQLDMVVTRYPKTSVQPLWYAIVTELERLDCMLNRFDYNSELKHINLQAMKNQV